MFNEFEWRLFVRRLIEGVLESLIIIILYIYIIPLVLSQIYTQLGLNEALIPVRGTTYYAVLGMILGLSVAARALEGTIFRPILSASANLVGLLYALTFFGSGVLSANNINVDGYTVSFSLDVSPLILVFFAFFGAPSVIIPFIEFFYKNK